MTAIYRTVTTLFTRITTVSIRSRIVINVVLFTLYALSFPWLESTFGGATAIVSTGPVVTTAWLLGLRAGLVASVVGFVISLALASAFDDETIVDWLTRGGLLGFLALIVTGATIGMLRDLSQRVRTELAVRRQLEAELRIANSELETRVADRTKQLSETNDSLRNEVTERTKSEQLLTRSQEMLRALAARMESVREDERSKIAHDIHDEFGQTITGLKFEVAWLQRRLSRIADPDLRDSFTNRIELIQSSLNTAIENVRDISSSLRPAVLDNFGLRAAVEWQAADFQGRTGVECNVNIRDEDFDVEREIEITLFRILQEALNNVARHASANHVSINVDRIDDCIHMEISDDGVGMNVNDGSERLSLGVLGMKERAITIGGDVELVSESDHGTTVKVSVPKH